MRIDVFSDMVCPFCYLGSRHLELALEQFDGAGDVEVAWRSFQLDPTAPVTSDQTGAQMLAEKYGMDAEQVATNHRRLADAGASVGLDLRLGSAPITNTHDAHRLAHLARELGGEDLAGRWVRRVMLAYFTENQTVGDHAVLRELAEEVGLDAQRVAAVLEGEEFTDQVQADIGQAQATGIQGVPFFVIDGRLGVSGAQPPEVLLEALRRASGAGEVDTAGAGTE